MLRIPWPDLEVPLATLYRNVTFRPDEPLTPGPS